MPASATLKTARLPWTEIFAVGKHSDDTREYTQADLDAMVRNFPLNRGLVDPPLVPGHEEFQPLTAKGFPGSNFLPPGTGFPKNSGTWSLGTVVGLKTEGGKLLARFDAIPPKFADLINAKRYRWVSIEPYDQPPPGCAGDGCMLRRVAILGGQLPKVKDLADVPAAYFAEMLEAVPMAESSTTETLIDVLAGLPAESYTPEVLKEMLTALPPDALNSVAGKVTPGAAAGTTTGEPVDAAELPPDFDRAAAIQAIIAADPTQDPAALEALDDQAVYDLWLQVTGGATAAAPAAALSEEKPAVPTLQTPAAVQKFAEAAIKRMEAKEAAFNRQVAVRQRAERVKAEAAERESAHKFCEELRRQGKVSPAECDGNAARGIPSLVDQIMDMPNDQVVAKFSEGGKSFSLTKRGRFKLALSNRTADPRKFSEQITVGAVDNDRKAYFDKLAADADARVAERAKNRKEPLAERLGLNAPKHRR